ncbi:PstS family phosphate ABC transporter substrate-binding protein [Chitinophagaceae bacterium MMS25-I14]
MQWFKTITLAACSTLLVCSCKDDVKKPEDTTTSGTIDISVDETYQPAIAEQLRVFDSSYPEAHINAHYKPESECFKDFLDNKARLILVTRELSAGEKELCTQKKIVPTSLALVKDAVAVIVNPESADSLLSIPQIKGILTGKYNKKYTVVFDNQGSSTVRYITDSLIPGEKLGTNVFAAKGNSQVVDYVAKNPDAIGFIGLSYISDENDSATESFLKKVKVVSVQNDSTQEFYQPYQAYIALKLYPFTRSLYFITRETFPGLGTGFANFLSKERGQLIFAHSHLFPLRMNIVIRDATLNNSNGH